MLTLVEYLLLLYRALLPTPVWYRFFLNKEYGSLFSSLMTGLYLTFKLTSIVEKVYFFSYIFWDSYLWQCLWSFHKVQLSGKSSFFHMIINFSSNPLFLFSPSLGCDVQVQSSFTAVKALSRKEVHYGAHATSEQVMWIFLLPQTSSQRMLTCTVFSLFLSILGVKKIIAVLWENLNRMGFKNWEWLGYRL